MQSGHDEGEGGGGGEALAGYRTLDAGEATLCHCNPEAAAMGPRPSTLAERSEVRSIESTSMADVLVVMVRQLELRGANLGNVSKSGSAAVGKVECGVKARINPTPTRAHPRPLGSMLTCLNLIRCSVTI